MRPAPFLAALLGALAPAAPAADGGALHPLFHIEKSDTRNEIHYAAALGPDCRFAADPVRVSWRRRGDPAAPPRPLDWLENALVYGVRVLEAGADRVTFTVAADDTRPVRLEAGRAGAECRVHARVRVLGEWVEPRRAFVEILDGRRLVPDIAHVDLHARRADGRELCERLTALRAPGLPCRSAPGPAP